MLSQEQIVVNVSHVCRIGAASCSLLAGEVMAASLLHMCLPEGQCAEKRANVSRKHVFKMVYNHIYSSPSIVVALKLKCDSRLPCQLVACVRFRVRGVVLPSVLRSASLSSEPKCGSEACFSSYMSMMCSSIFPRCTRFGLHKAVWSSSNLCHCTFRVAALLFRLGVT